MSSRISEMSGILLGVEQYVRPLDKTFTWVGVSVILEILTTDYSERYI